MERYLVDVTNLRLDSQQQPQISPDGTPKARMYLAAPVDARIAELEKALQEIVRTAATVPGDVCGGGLHPYVAQYLVSARKIDAARELMVSETK